MAEEKEIIMPSEIQMKLEQIKTFLKNGKASVMVGAGFSKNAQVLEFAKMKDWNEISETIFKQLFVQEEDRKRNSEISHDALKISQMYECSFGRNALDNHIENALPNESTAPGNLHKRLMRLSWRDVFTTNYDTLLERAALESDRPYQVVTNKETLLYKSSPRIIKLHGSFPNIRPYIITEEDFRTYPQRFPEFVNTVRQALMESVFCLIGFSGNDPNFLQWLGWLRDVMGNQASPVYLITYESHQHKAQVELFKRRGIEIINIASIRKDISYSEGLEMVLTYLGKDEDAVWRPEIGNANFDTAEDIVKETERMRHHRESYPNYLYLPKTIQSEFDNAYPFYQWIKTELLEQLTVSQRLRFVYEIIWLYEVSISPIFVQWILDEMERISFAEAEDEEDLYYANEIRLSLLTSARVHGDDSYFERLVEKINEKTLQTAQWHRYYYEQCLYRLNLLDYKEVRVLLDKWDVNGTSITSVLWKALVLSEIGQDNEAVNLLNITNQRFKQSLLAQGIHDESTLSYSNALDEVLELLDSQRMSDTPLNDFKRILVQRMFEAQNQPSSLYEYTHKFGINNIQTTWHSSTSDKPRLLSGYHYFRLLEIAGYPLGHTHFTINEAWLQAAIPCVVKYLPTYAFRILLRSRSQKATIGCFTRRVVLDMPQNWADEQYEKFKAKIDDYIAQSTRNAYTIKIGDVLIPAFAHLSPRLDEGHIDDLREQYLKIYNERKPAYNTEHFRIVLSNLFSGGKARANYAMLSETTDDWLMQLPWSHEWMHVTKLHDDVVNTLAQKIRNMREPEDKGIFARLGYMLMADLTNEQRVALEDAVRCWRNKDLPAQMTEQVMNSYKSVKFSKGKDIRNTDYYVDEVVGRIAEANVDKVSGTTILLHLRESFRMIEEYAGQMSTQQHEIVLGKFHRLLVENERILMEDDSSSFMGGFRGELHRLIIHVTRYVANAGFEEVDEQLLRDIQDTCVRYMTYHAATIAIVAKLNNYTKTINNQQMIEFLKSALIKGEHYECTEGLYAVEIIENHEVQSKLIQFIIDYSENAQNKRVKFFVQWIRFYLVDGKMPKRSWLHKVDELLNRIADSLADFAGDEETRMDIMYQANMLAGVVCAKWGDIEGVLRWKEITLDRKNFNDVRASFDLGQDRVIKDKDALYDRLLLHG